MIELLGINYLLDIHGLAAWRQCDINLGTHIGKNVETSPKLLDDLKDRLTKAGFVVWVDQPFMATSTAISSAAKNKYPNLWTLQIEINCGITNQPQNIAKYNKLLAVLTEWINSLK